MRLVCPECEASYELPETMFLTGPRMVRCVRCSHAWMAGIPAAEAAPPADVVEPAVAETDSAAEALATRRQSPLRRRAAPAPTEAGPIPPLDMGIDPPTRPRTGMWVLAGWIFTLVFVAAAGWGGWLYRDDIIEAWPASARLYEVLGAREAG